MPKGVPNDKETTPNQGRPKRKTNKPDSEDEIDETLQPNAKRPKKGGNPSNGNTTNNKKGNASKGKTVPITSVKKRMSNPKSPESSDDESEDESEVLDDRSIDSESGSSSESNSDEDDTSTVLTPAVAHNDVQSIEKSQEDTPTNRGSPTHTQQHSTENTLHSSSPKNPRAVPLVQPSTNMSSSSTITPPPQLPLKAPTNMITASISPPPSQPPLNPPTNVNTPSSTPTPSQLSPKPPTNVNTSFNTPLPSQLPSKPHASSPSQMNPQQKTPQIRTSGTNIPQSPTQIPRGVALSSPSQVSKEVPTSSTTTTKVSAQTSTTSPASSATINISNNNIISHNNNDNNGGEQQTNTSSILSMMIQLIPSEIVPPEANVFCKASTDSRMSSNMPMSTISKEEIDKSKNSGKAKHLLDLMTQITDILKEGKITSADIRALSELISHKTLHQKRMHLNDALKHPNEYLSRAPNSTPNSKGFDITKCTGDSGSVFFKINIHTDRDLLDQLNVLTEIDGLHVSTQNVPALDDNWIKGKIQFPLANTDYKFYSTHRILFSVYFKDQFKFHISYYNHYSRHMSEIIYSRNRLNIHSSNIPTQSSTIIKLTANKVIKHLEDANVSICLDDMKIDGNRISIPYHIKTNKNQPKMEEINAVLANQRTRPDNVTMAMTQLKNANEEDNNKWMVRSRALHHLHFGTNTTFDGDEKKEASLLSKFDKLTAIIMRFKDIGASDLIKVMVSTLRNSISSKILLNNEENISKPCVSWIRWKEGEPMSADVFTLNPMAFKHISTDSEALDSFIVTLAYFFNRDSSISEQIQSTFDSISYAMLYGGSSFCISKHDVNPIVQQLIATGFISKNITANVAVYNVPALITDEQIFTSTSEFSVARFIPEEYIGEYLAAYYRAVFTPCNKILATIRDGILFICNTMQFRDIVDPNHKA